MLDSVMPRFDAREHHARRVAHAPADAVARMLEISAAPDGITRALFALRRVPGRDGTIADLARSLRLERVVDDSAAVVYCGRTRVRIGIAFWAEPDGAGSNLHTETRVLAADRRARRLFRAYWLVIRPFSGLIRRRWLRAAAR